MSAEDLRSIRDRISIITFDCYGPLVDWETGLGDAIRDAAGRCDPVIFDAYVKTEAQVEAEPYRSYRDVTAETLRRVAARFGLTIPQHHPGGATGSLSARVQWRANRQWHQHAVAGSLPDWPLWPDTNAALERLKRRYRIGVLSNVDRDLFAGTARHFTIDIDPLITAEDVQAYKPSHDHFLRMLECNGCDRGNVLHAAQSWFHDCVPAARLDIMHVWINRRAESPGTDARPLAIFPNLTALADALGV